MRHLFSTLAGPEEPSKKHLVTDDIVVELFELKELTPGRRALRA